jgi:hypothetical protein
MVLLYVVVWLKQRMPSSSPDAVGYVMLLQVEVKMVLCETLELFLAKRRR